MKLGQNKKSKRVILTGGHAATTALATIEEILRRSERSKWEIFWIGSSQALEGSKVFSLEHRLFSKKAGVSYHPVIMGRLQRKWSIYTIPSLLKIPLGLIQSFYLILKIRPQVILSFGGFAAFPVVLAGFVLRIPIVIHDQTAAVGLVNRLSSIFAKRVALARKESKVYFPTRKTILVGNPLMAAISEIKPKRKPDFPPTLFVFGGSRGARTINRTIDKILVDLLKTFIIIHLTGNADFDYFSQKRKKMSSEEQARYEVYSFIEPTDIASVYRRADIIIARAGANTVSEIISTARPAILVPIPWSYQDEQNKNAALAKKSGIALVLDQDSLTAEILKEKIFFLKENWDKMVSGMNRKISILDKRASVRLVDLIETMK